MRKSTIKTVNKKMMHYSHRISRHRDLERFKNIPGHQLLFNATNVTHWDISDLWGLHGNQSLVSLTESYNKLFRFINFNYNVQTKTSVALIYLFSRI